MDAQRICSVDGCGKPSLYRGWCNAHYQRWQKYGDPLGKAPTRPPKPINCQAPDCTRGAKAAGLCIAHYLRKRANGTFETKKAHPLTRRAFMEAAIASETDDCILWPFGKDKAGYGTIRINGNRATVNRQVCERVYGFANGLLSRHSCHNKACINPRHLSWGTPMQNVHDSIAVGAMQRGERNGHAKLTQNDVIEIRSSKVTANEFAKRLGVSARYIGQIRRRERWRHVD